LAEFKPGAKVLDVACGTGATLPALSEAVGEEGEIVGVDLSPKMLEKAEERAADFEIDNVTFRQGDVEKLSLEFDEESFDAVVSCNGLPNFLRPQRAIVEMCHVLREGGRLALSTLNRDLCEEKLLFYLGMRFQAGRFPYKQEFRTMLEQLGFVRIKMRERGLMLVVIADKGSSKRGDSAQASSAPRRQGPRKISPDNL
jgi:SAM-dependent methyltransferase